MAKRILVLKIGAKTQVFTVKIRPPKRLKITKARERRLKAERAVK